MAQYAAWHGTVEESRELQRAVNRHCSCAVLAQQAPASCAAHEMLTLDQRAIDGLLFARRIVRRLLDEELRVLQPTQQHAQVLEQA